MEIEILEMTSAECRNGLHVNYNWYETPFGKMIVASTAIGICYMAFAEDEDDGLKGLKKRYPGSVLVEHSDQYHRHALEILMHKPPTEPLTLHINGTDFQLKVWKALLRIPPGQLSTYSKIASETGYPKATRAVGNAIGNNPVACLIPCHRVIRSDGSIGGYMWGKDRKIKLIKQEQFSTGFTE